MIVRVTPSVIVAGIEDGVARIQMTVDVREKSSLSIVMDEMVVRDWVRKFRGGRGVWDVKPARFTRVRREVELKSATMGKASISGVYKGEDLTIKVAPPGLMDALYTVVSNALDGGVWMVKTGKSPFARIILEEEDALLRDLYKHSRAVAERFVDVNGTFTVQFEVRTDEFGLVEVVF